MARAHRRPIARFKGNLLPGEHFIEGARPEEVIRIEEIFDAASAEVAIAFLVMDPDDLPDHALFPPRLAAIGVGFAFALVAHMMLGAHRSACSSKGNLLTVRTTCRTAVMMEVQPLTVRNEHLRACLAQHF